MALHLTTHRGCGYLGRWIKSMPLHWSAVTAAFQCISSWPKVEEGSFVNVGTCMQANDDFNGNFFSTRQSAGHASLKHGGAT